MTNYEEQFLWDQDYVHADDTLLGMLVRHISQGYIRISNKYSQEFMCVLGLSLLCV